MPLINPKKIFKNSKKNKVGLCAFNFVNYEIAESILNVANELNCDVILQASEGAVKYYTVENLVAICKNFEKKYKINFALHLDHGVSFEMCKKCIDAGFTSVMIDASALSFDENVCLTKKVATYAHTKGVFCEGELGKLSGVEDNISSRDSLFTNPQDAKKFIEQTGVDSLAISVGTSHGAYKLPVVGGLMHDTISQISCENKNTFLVLHGASNVDSQTIVELNALGATLTKTSGIAIDETLKAIKNGITKINIDSDLRLAFTLGVRKLLSENPKEFDIRKINIAGMEEVKKTVRTKLEVLCKK